MKRVLETPRSITFERVSEEKNERRFYAIEVAPTLFHAHAFTVRRGRIGARLIVKDEAFVTAEQLASRWRELVGRRRRHGYTER